MKEKWILRAKKADFFALSEKYGVDPVIIRLMVNRGIAPEEMGRYLHPSPSDMHSPHDLKDADRAADILKEEIGKGSHIRIIGDYDIDGINSTYILYKALKNLGANISYAIPHRVKDGYGLNMHLIEEAKKCGANLIITCDNGIAAAKEIEYANSLGIKVIVTDHHEVPFVEEDGEKKEILPRALAIVNPKQKECNYPFEGICGAVVAWKLMYVLYEKMSAQKDALDNLIENAGFATVGDVMDLCGENRYIVKAALEKMNMTQNPGLKELINRTGIQRPACYHLGFVLGPCFNASGRLESADEALGLLLADDKTAPLIAEKLIRLNEERKALTEEGAKEACRISEECYKDDRILVVYLPKVHESIAGIIAGRLKERFNKPSFVITGEGETVKGSGRSIAEYSMYEEMNKVSDIFVKFGGHPMAAGFSLAKSRVDEMRKRLNEKCLLTEDDLIPKKYIDADMPIGYISEKLIKELELLEPMGKGNEKPVFADKNAAFTFAKRIGKDGNMLRVTLEEGGKKIKGMYFSDADDFLDELDKRFGGGSRDILLSGRGSFIVPFTYYPQLNEFRGHLSVQVVITGVLW